MNEPSARDLLGMRSVQGDRVICALGEFRSSPIKISGHGIKVGMPAGATHEATTVTLRLVFDCNAD